MNATRLIPRVNPSLKLRIGIFMLLALVVFWGSSHFLDMRNDDAYITYRYAQNLVQGRGLVFNPGEYVLATTSPLHALMLSVVALVYPNLPLAAIILSGVALLALGFYIYMILEHLGYPRAGLISALIIILNIHTYSVFPLETIILVSLEIASIYYALRQELIIAALLGACAVLTRFDAVTLTIALLIHYVITRRSLRRLPAPAAVFLVMVLGWFAFSFTYYGSWLPTTAFAKTGFADHALMFVGSIWPKVLSISIANSPHLSAIPVVFTLISLWLIWRTQRWDLVVIPLWGVLYIMGYSILSIGFPHSWYYYPLVVATLALGCLGANNLYDSIKKRLSFRGIRLLKVVTVLLVSTLLVVQAKTVYDYSIAHHQSPWTTAREQAYVEVSDWLRKNTSKRATIAALEIGTLGYFSDRSIVDLLGLVTPAAIPNVRTGDWGKTIAELNPDYVVVQNRVGEDAVDAPGSGTLVFLGRSFSNYQAVQRFISERYEITVYQSVDEMSQ